MDVLPAATEARGHRVLRFRQAVLRLMAGAQDGLRVGQALVFFVDGRIFGLADVERGQLIDLIAQQGAFGLDLRALRLDGPELFGERLPALMDALESLQKRPAAAGLIQQFTLRLGPGQGLIGMLAVDVDQLPAEFAQGLRGRGDVVDVGAGTAVLADGAADKQFGLAFDIQRRQPLAERRVPLDHEDRGDVGLVGAAPDQPGVGARAQDQAQRVQQDRLAGPGLPGQDRHAGVKIQAQPVNHGEIIDNKLA